MRTLRTERLVLRPFRGEDVGAVQSYAGDSGNTTFMLWGPNTVEETREFVRMAMMQAEVRPCVEYHYAVDLDGEVIGGCSLSVAGDEGEIGWILHRDYWRQGFGTEIGMELLKMGFDELKLHRILAHCDAENIGSYRIVENIGMRREGLFIEGRPGNKTSGKKYGDELSYAILRDEWEVGKEIAYYNTLPCEFSDFIDVPELSDGVVHLVCIAKDPARPEMNWVPSYEFIICRGSQKVGDISIRIGYGGGMYGSNLYYGGQIGYNVDEEYRGNGYAVRACRLLLPVARAHKMEKLLITNGHTNDASRRVCEKLGARLVRVALLPEWHDLYRDGQRYVNIFEWN